MRPVGFTENLGALSSAAAVGTHSAAAAITINMDFMMSTVSVGCRWGGELGAACHFAGLFQFLEFILGLFELFLKGRVGMQSRDSHSPCYAPGVHIALEW